MKVVDYYELLGVERNADDEQIKRAYRQLALRYHPDTAEDGGSQHLFQQITEAYNILSDPKEKEKYDKELPAYIDPNDSQLGMKFKEFEKKNEQPNPETAEALKRGTDRLKQNQGDGDSFSGLNNLRFGGKKTRSPDESLGAAATHAFKNVKKGMKNLFQDDSPPKIRKKAESTFVARNYQVTVDALESLQGTTREIAYGNPEDPKMATVEVPPLVKEGEIVHAVVPDLDSAGTITLEVKVNIASHEFVERSGNDITLKNPCYPRRSFEWRRIRSPNAHGSRSTQTPKAQHQQSPPSPQRPRHPRWSQHRRPLCQHLRNTPDESHNGTSRCAQDN